MNGAIEQRGWQAVAYLGGFALAVLLAVLVSPWLFIVLGLATIVWWDLTT